MLSLLAVVSLLLCHLGAGAQNTTSAQDAVAFALTYGYPLLAYQTLADRFLPFNATNFLYNARELSTADNKTVVKPNVCSQRYGFESNN